MEALLEFIYSAGEDDLRIITDAVNARRESLRKRKTQEMLRTLRVGDKVTLTNVKPKYLIGTGGTIIERRGTKFVVELDDYADKRAIARFGGRPICPPTILQKMN